MKKITASLFVFLFIQTTLTGQEPDTLQSITRADTIHAPDTLHLFSWADTIHDVEFNRDVIIDPLQLILGKEAGAEVFKAGSDPCFPSSIMIRGENGLYNEKSPLYVIDGVIGGDLFMVPPQEIASFRILKDLSETSRYGSEGGRGVIIVTTKEPVKNKHRRQRLR